MREHVVLAVGAAGRIDSRRRGGITLIEMMIAMVITLIIVLAVVRIIQAVGNEVRNGRATIEMSGRIRAASDRLRNDLLQVSLPVRPWPKVASGLGYFEYYEGPRNDSELLSVVSPIPEESIRGDIDDVLMFTSISRGEPYAGRFYNGISNVTIESQAAEIAWWTELAHDFNNNGVWDPGDELVLHRRVLLIRPDLNGDHATYGRMLVNPGAPPLTPLTGSDNIAGFLNVNDLSVRPVRNSMGIVVGMAANSLADLTQRENRFAHNDITITITAPIINQFPHAIKFAALGTPYDSAATPPAGYIQSGNGYIQSGNSKGLDVILGHVVGFDVRVYDPEAPIYFDDPDRDHAMSPGDVGWNASHLAAAGDPTLRIGTGAYVDLGYYQVSPIPSIFAGPPDTKSQLADLPSPGSATYCTWSWHYETDGIDQDGDVPTLIDEGTNGLDENGVRGPDDYAERETSPPYAVPLRGIEIRIRVVEQDSNQARQTTVLANFMPE